MGGTPHNRCSTEVFPTWRAKSRHQEPRPFRRRKRSNTPGDARVKQDGGIQSFSVLFIGFLFFSKSSLMIKSLYRAAERGVEAS